jgi:hypothetical protein
MEVLISYTTIYFKLKLHQKDIPLVRRMSVEMKTILVPPKCSVFFKFFK